MISISRYHDISAGHRVVGHENKCSHLHGHNFRVHFTVTAESLDDIGRVIDFSIIKAQLCDWLETHWDHRFLMYEADELLIPLQKIVSEDIVSCPFNPTAENMAQYLCEVIGPQQLKGTGCQLIKCTIEETRKCSATYEIS
jgi:6-pyruvoyltetrahydropterin/6-carboxytetrahydropterin synthase